MVACTASSVKCGRPFPIPMRRWAGLYRRIAASLAIFHPSGHTSPVCRLGPRVQHDAINIVPAVFAGCHRSSPGCERVCRAAGRPRSADRSPDSEWATCPRLTCAAQRLGDVLDPPHRNLCQVHLDQHFLDRARPPPVALDDCRLEGLPRQLGNPEADLSARVSSRRS